MIDNKVDIDCHDFLRSYLLDLDLLHVLAQH